MQKDPHHPKNRLELPQVTLCAVSSSNVEATLRAIEASIAEVEFAEAILFTHEDSAALSMPAPAAVRIVKIEKIESSNAYSQFMLSQLNSFIRTSHCLIVQWDGHVIDGTRWRDEFLEYDYIGASWPQFGDGRTVGNGGFSLRSKRLLRACSDHSFVAHHPEDIAICRTNRTLLEGQGLSFPGVDIADQFAAERAGDPAESFGYHGVFLMPKVLGQNRFWDIYDSLDDRTSLWRDFGVVFGAVLRGDNGLRRGLKVIADRIRAQFGSI